jgi:hypothetical protein
MRRSDGQSAPSRSLRPIGVRPLRTTAPATPRAGPRSKSISSDKQGCSPILGGNAQRRIKGIAH